MNRKERRQASASVRAKSLPGADPALARDFRDAVQYLQAGRLHDSDLAHRRVLAKLPRHAPSLHHLGLIAFKRNARSEAVDYIRQSLAIDPNYYQAWLNLAVILGEMRRAEEAIDECRSHDAAAHKLRSLCRAWQPSARCAEQRRGRGRLLRSLRLKPAQPDVLARLGELLLKSGDAFEALAHRRRALEIDPNHEAAQTLERRILASTRALDKAEALLEAQSKIRRNWRRTLIN